MDQNLYWNTAESDYKFNNRSFKKWQKTGHDAHSFIADPMFKDPKAFNFQLRSKKNINKIDFKPFDYKNAGVAGNKKWKEKGKLPNSITNEFDKTVKNNMKINSE